MWPSRSPLDADGARRAYHVRVSPRTRITPLLSVALLAGGVPLLLAACGEPPQPLPTSPPFSELPSGLPSGTAPSGGLPAAGLPTATGAPLPTGLLPTPGYPGYPANGGYGGYPPPPVATTTTTPVTTNSPTPTPSHAPKCVGTTQPTAAQILALIKGKPGIPKETLKVFDGPYCSADWSFALVGVASTAQSKQDPLFVVGVGSGSGLALVTAGSDVCNDPVQKDAPAGIRVMACGF
jgi:hypothetical protein